MWRHYFDRTFWKMAAGFVIIIAFGLIGVYLINFFAKS